MSDTFDKVARAVYDALEGPISSQDFVRQMAQWERAKKVARAAMDAMQEAGRASEAEPAADGVKLHGPYGWLICPEGLAEDDWQLERKPVDEQFADTHVSIPLYAKVDPFKATGSGGER